MIKEKKTYYVNGQLAVHCFWKDGKRHGEYKKYFKSGQLEIHCFYKDGYKHGEYKTYWYTGKMTYHTIFVENEDLNINPATLSKEDKLALKLKHNIEFLDD